MKAPFKTIATQASDVIFAHGGPAMSPTSPEMVALADFIHEQNDLAVVRALTVLRADMDNSSPYARKIDVMIEGLS